VLGVEDIDQEDPRLWKTIRRHYGIAPSKQKYKLLNETEDPSMGQTRLIQQLMGNMVNLAYILISVVCGTSHVVVNCDRLI
jgi:hypothetical protein